ncbi:MAG: type I DNA topoisomerase [bacterium]
MEKNLVIVESPAKCKTISKILGKNYIIKASMGHVMDLPKKELGIDIDKDFKPHYVIIPSRKKIINELIKCAKESNNIYLATDPDREGEAIGWHIASLFKKKVVYRITFNEITEQAITSSLKNPRQIDMNKVNAQQTRRILDRLVGYQISPLLWQCLKENLSAGRVQSIATRLICEREKAIEKFIPQEYWEIIANLETKSHEKIESKLLKYKQKKIEIFNETQSKELIETIKAKEFIVDKVKFQEKKKFPYPPFITSTLQQESYKKLGFPTEKTMRIAQQLYEGLKISNETIGLITYMRTDSTRISQDAIKETRDYIVKKFNKEYCPEKPNYYASKSSAQDAHEAIRPTFIEKEPEKIKNELTPEQFKLYELIWNRFLSCQMAPALLAITTIDILSGDYLFRTSGTIIKFYGFMKIYQEEEEENKNENILPSICEKEILQLLDLIPSQHFTKPPARFTEATLVKELEQQGIGRPSTYATIINTIQLRNYVKKEKGKFYPTELGIVVNDILVKNFPKILDIAFTAHLEEDLDRIEKGDREWKKILIEFYKPFYQELQNAKLELKGIKNKLETSTDEVCELCGCAMKIKWGRYGKFLACAEFPKCKNTKNIFSKESESSKKDIKQLEEKCSLCGGDLLIKASKFGEFVACNNYPKCKFTKPISFNIKCPEKDCSGEIIKRKSKKGKIFWHCTKYPECKFINWYKPVNKTCPTCNNNFLIEKGNKLKCGNKECAYEAEQEEA